MRKEKDIRESVANMIDDTRKVKALIFKTQDGRLYRTPHLIQFEGYIARFNSGELYLGEEKPENKFVKMGIEFTNKLVKVRSVKK